MKVLTITERIKYFEDERKHYIGLSEKCYELNSINLAWDAEQKAINLQSKIDELTVKSWAAQ